MRLYELFNQIATLERITALDHSVVHYTFKFRTGCGILGQYSQYLRECDPGTVQT